MPYRPPKQEDNRDVFEKALDYAPAAGAVIGGALLGRTLSRIGARPPSPKIVGRDASVLSQSERSGTAGSSAWKRRTKPSKKSQGSNSAGAVLGATFVGAPAIGYSVAKNTDARRRK